MVYDKEMTQNEDGHTRETHHVTRGLGHNTSMTSRRGINWRLSSFPDQGFNQLGLCNETSINFAHQSLGEHSCLTLGIGVRVG